MRRDTDLFGELADQPVGTETGDDREVGERCIVGRVVVQVVARAGYSRLCVRDLARRGTST